MYIYTNRFVDEAREEVTEENRHMKPEGSEKNGQFADQTDLELLN